MKVDVIGLRELKAALQALGIEAERKIAVRAMLASMQIARRAVAAATYGGGITRRTGLLKQGIGVRMVKQPQANDMRAAGVFVRKITMKQVAKRIDRGMVRTYRLRGGSRKILDKPYYWRFLEFGTKKMSARPYAGPAFSAVASQVLDRFRVLLGKGIEAEAAKRAKA